MSNADDQTRTMIANLPEKTGRSLDDWLKMTRALDAGKHGEILRWLKTEHGISHGFANLIAHETLRAPQTAGADPLDAQYGGDKAALRPIYDAIVRAVQGFGRDVEVAPKKTYVSLRRKKQFALVQPTTKTRVDVGINLKGKAPTARLEASGSFNAMVSHRVRIGSAAEVDRVLIDWLRQAYDAAG